MKLSVFPFSFSQYSLKEYIFYYQHVEFSAETKYYNFSKYQFFTFYYRNINLGYTLTHGLSQNYSFSRKVWFYTYIKCQLLNIWNTDISEDNFTSFQIPWYGLHVILEEPVD